MFIDTEFTQYSGSVGAECKDHIALRWSAYLG